MSAPTHERRPGRTLITKEGQQRQKAPPGHRNKAIFEEKLLRRSPKIGIKQTPGKENEATAARGRKIGGNFTRWWNVSRLPHTSPQAATWLQNENEYAAPFTYSRRQPPPFCRPLVI